MFWKTQDVRALLFWKLSITSASQPLFTSLPSQQLSENAVLGCRIKQNVIQQGKVKKRVWLQTFWARSVWVCGWVSYLFFSLHSYMKSAWRQWRRYKTLVWVWRVTKLGDPKKSNMILSYLGFWFGNHSKITKKTLNQSNVLSKIRTERLFFQISLLLLLLDKLMQTDSVKSTTAAADTRTAIFLFASTSVFHDSNTHESYLESRVCTELLKACGQTHTGKCWGKSDPRYLF